MRRLSASRASTAVAVVAAIVAVLAVLSPGLGFGQEVFGHGGTPTDVYTQTFDAAYCGNVQLNQGGQTLMEQSFTLEAESNVVVWFTFQFGFENPRQEGLLAFGLDGGSMNNEWGIAAPGSTTAQSFSVRQSTTLSWSFDNVAPGPHRVTAFGRVSTGLAGLNTCAMTVLVTPVV